MEEGVRIWMDGGSENGWMEGVGWRRELDGRE